MINEEIGKYPFIKNIVINEDSLVNFEKNRKELIKLMKNFFNRKLIKMSLKELR